jgi:SAM-dependent methyltransferase
LKGPEEVQVAKFWNDIAHDFDAIYSGKNKSAFSRTLDKIFRADIYGRFEWVMEKAGDLRGKRVCDIGCGSGRFVVEFAKRGAAQVVGVDVAPEMLKLAKELAEKEGVADRCTFVLADVEDWKTTETFDVVIALGLWDYVADPSSRLAVIRKLTRDKFLSAWPRFWTWRMPVRKLRLSVAGCPVHFFRKPVVEKFLTDAGFTVATDVVVGKLFCADARPAGKK